MNYAEIKYFDIANGPGCRTSLFVSGCTHHCVGCFNQCTWDFNYGNKYTEIVENEILNSLKNKYVSGLSILGGEPFEIENQSYLKNLISRYKNEVDNADIWIYSGYTFEELLGRKNEDTIFILSNIDTLVDGEFILDKKDISLKFRGSSNQRIINVQESLKNNKVIIVEKI